MFLHLGDCLEVMRTLADNSVDACVTSPPYDSLREYNGAPKLEFIPIAREIFRVIKQGGVVVWIVADQTINGNETASSFAQAIEFKKIGFRLHDTMIWDKGISPFQDRNRYINSFEYMFVFSKGSPKTANIIRDRKNKYFGFKIHGTARQKNGKTKELSEIQKSKTVKEYGSRLNIWKVTPEKNNRTGHPAVFPQILAEDHIKTWTNSKEVILDPFMGSGTTGIAAKKLDRDFIGIEISTEYFEIAKKRIEAS